MGSGCMVRTPPYERDWDRQRGKKHFIAYADMITEVA